MTKLNVKAQTKKKNCAHMLAHVHYVTVVYFFVKGPDQYSSPCLLHII